jgi:hypothetical protein
MKPDELRKLIQDKKAAQDAIKAEFKAKEKGKPLSTAERLDRIERLLGLDK